MLTLMVLGRINEHENKHVQSVILSVTRCRWDYTHNLGTGKSTSLNKFKIILNIVSVFT
jgi:hypothetical protein